MLHLLYALALLLLLCGACAILAERFTLSPALLPLPVLSGAVVVLYLCGVAGFLRVGAVAVLLALAAGDCSASMARTYDIEIQIPSMNGYKEVSSVSNARDYQARRGNIRFRREATGKPEFVHTLNGSGLATSRIFPAMVEQNQRADGSVVVPEVLRKYLGGIEVIEKK